MKKFARRGAAWVLSGALFCMWLSACRSPASSSSSVSSVVKESAAWTSAQTTPLGTYPQTVTYTLGKMTTQNNSNMPKGDTYENNAYTRYLKKILNVQNRDTFEIDGDINYESELELEVSNGKIPDVMVVTSRDFLKKLVQNDLVANLTDAYQTCCSPRIRDMYKSYSGLLQSVTFNGKIMALPETSIENGPNLLWLRKDWLTKLGLNPPKTLDDLETILKAFVQRDPGASSAGHTLGLVCRSNLMDDTGACYSINPIFEQFGAYPRRWVRGTDGKLVYGSVMPGAQKALAKLQTWYREGLIDANFPLRQDDNLGDLVAQGRVGALFGWWWAPNDPLIRSVQKDSAADWEPYLLLNSGSGVKTTSTAASQRYIVVRKGYSHPEVIMKIMSTLYDYARYQDPSPTTLESYFSHNVGSTATPLVLNCDYSDAAVRTTRHIQAAMQGTLQTDRLSMLERAYYRTCKSYLAAKKKEPLQWAAYTSRITAVNRLIRCKISYVDEDCSFEDSTPSDKLSKLEQETYLRIITGSQPVSAFDSFVQNWYNQGGAELTTRANAQS
ncbi:MAG: extracellular solute-binding protein [Oscillospiraceae bacterium]|nr:extracellular solute-binding protein [Oscillospiraceae bacterium]